MLKTKKQKIIAATSAVVIVGTAFFLTKAVLNKGGLKTYTLSNVALVVSNSDSCGAIFNSLSKLAENELKLEFTSTKEDKKFAVKHSEETLLNHTHAIVKQNSATETVYRVGVGEFEIEGKKVDYVITTSTDIKHPSYKHLYPLILSADNAHCYFTALIQPSADTTEDFIKDVKAGEAQKGADLSNDSN